MITDLTPYRKHVDQFDLTEKQKLDLVNSVWMIVDSIFDYHMGLNKLPAKNRPFDFEKTKQQKPAEEEVKADGDASISSRKPEKTQARSKRPRKTGSASSNGADA